MNPNQLNKLRAATTSVAQDLTRTMSGNVRICPEMPGQNRRNAETNPPRTEVRRKALSPRQFTAIALLLRGKTAAATARTLEINERTVRRWQADPRFSAELSRRAEEMSGFVRKRPAIQSAGTNPKPPSFAWP
jgi:hypothetical protein